MKNSVLFMLKLIASVISETPPPEVPQDANWKLIYDIANSHGIISIIAHSHTFHNSPVPADLHAKFEQCLYEHFFLSEKQYYECKNLISSFEKAGISYMPLKGLVLQDLYPKREMRPMADADILIKKEEYEKIKCIMSDLGYCFYSESDHEYNYIKKPYMHVELHKRLIPSYNHDMYKYFGNGWKMAVKSKDSDLKYELSLENNFIYILSHLAKHYRDGGIGIKHIIDIWLFSKKHSLDKTYLEKELKKLNLYEFYKNIIRLTEAWFENGEFDKLTTNITNYILNSNCFGTGKNSISAQAIRESKNVKTAAKFKHIKLIFPKLEKMKKIFPVLEKFPALLPVMWIYRVLRLILFRRDRISINLTLADNIDQDHINKYSEHMIAVGLDIYNGRRHS